MSTTPQEPPAPLPVPPPAAAEHLTVLGHVPHLAAALAKFQASLPRIGKDSTADAGTYRYDYAGLDAVARHVMPLLGENGLAFATFPTIHHGRFALIYSLLHESGERLDGVYPLAERGTPQQRGSEITYARRYTLLAVTGVAPGGDDDDGAAAGTGETPPRKAQRQDPGPPTAQPRRPAPPSPDGPIGTVPGTATRKQLTKLGATFSDLGFTTGEREQRLTVASQITGRELATSADLSASEASHLIDTLTSCGTRDNLIELLAASERNEP
jgi:hypothetical protein